MFCFIRVAFYRYTELINLHSLDQGLLVGKILMGIFCILVWHNFDFKGMDELYRQIYQ